MQRRAFLSRSAAALAAATTLPHARTASAQEASGEPANIAIPRVTHPGTMRGEMLYRPLGATGVEVSVIGIGGSHLAKATLSEDVAIRIVHEGLDRGITFLDNAWDYNEGRSEERMGKALAQSGYREKAFLMTKIDGRTKEAAAAQIDTSLQRLKTDRIDLLQHHEVIRFDDPDRIFNEGGAMEAVVAARQAGKVRFIGFTGHKDPHVHLYMLEVARNRGFHFDTVQMPINLMDAHYRSFARLVVPEAINQHIGVLGMKCFGSGVILKSGAAEPLEYLHYCLTVPISVQITGIDKPEILEQAFAAVKSFRPLDEQGVAALLSKSREAASRGQYELFKTTAHFDSTARHPDWLGADSEAVQKLAPELPG